MVKIDPSAWPDERLAAQTLEQLKSLRINAERLGSDQIVAACDRELAKRAPARKPRTMATSTRNSSGVVVGYHFVCQDDRGVTQLGEGKFATASWVVAEDRVRNSLAYGAYVALHESRAEPSYRQGKLIGYDLKPRNMLDSNSAKTRMGIEFVVASTTDAYAWVGEATGEKGYLWNDGVGTGESETSGEAAP